MRILVFSPFYPPHVGGLESHSDEFNKHVSARGVLITVFTPQLPSHASASEVRFQNVRIIRFPACELFHNYPFPAFWNIRFWQLWTTLCSDHYDVVLSRTRFFFPSLMALWYAKTRTTPLLHIEHGSDFAHFHSRLKTAIGKLYDWLIGRLVLKYADTIVANSKASAQFVSYLSGRTDVAVIYRGANSELIKSFAPRQELVDRYQGKTIIAFVGRLIDGKGAHDLISALALLRRTDILTYIIGSGPDEAQLKEMVRMHQLNDQVVFFGNLAYEEAISTLKTADIVVNPSYTEGLPTSVTEAALCRKAIIATEVGGTPEVISGTHDGFLIPPGQSSLIAEKITLLVENPELRSTFSQNAYEEVRIKFNWDISAIKYIEIFQSMVSDKKT